MRYALARWNLYQREETYRIYMTDALKALGNLNIRYIDYFKPVDTRTADDVIASLRAGLERIGGNNEPI